MMQRSYRILAITITLLSIPLFAAAQTYFFQVEEQIVNIYWNADGTASIDYVFVFTNGDGVSPIDYVDIGLPNDKYARDLIFADINGMPISDIQESPYLTHGVALGLSEGAIEPGGTGTVHAFIGVVEDVIYPDDLDGDYASVVFIPSTFGSEFVYGNTDYTVVYHLPQGVQPHEPRWHAAPTGFPDEPETGIDDEGRITYLWHNPDGNAYSEYTFGASFPTAYIPTESVVRPSIWVPVAALISSSLAFAPCAGFAIIIAVITIFAFRSSKRRKQQYLPPVIAIEGHGIKRGLTAIEAAILMEQPLDKILTMILFSVIKKDAASVISRDPLKLQNADPVPEDLHTYEIDFLTALQIPSAYERKKALQNMMVALVKSISQKMKGFDRKETIAYYKNIIDRAWIDVEAAGTPEVKTLKFDEVLQWTMLDRDYEARTERLFRDQMVILPQWWGRYNPGYTHSITPSQQNQPPGFTSPKTVSLPHLPGSDFAAGLVNSAQDFSANTIGSIAGFTTAITKITNPIPKSSYASSRGSSGKRSSFSGGSSCACACVCACAGCACACAGGGR